MQIHTKQSAPPTPGLKRATTLLIHRSPAQHQTQSFTVPSLQPSLSNTNARPPLNKLTRQPSPQPRPSLSDSTYLLTQSRWIRDELDPQIAREGPDALHSDDILTLDSLLRGLLSLAEAGNTSTGESAAAGTGSKLTLETLRTSRMHNALLAITSHATRWPSRIILRAETLIGVLEAQFGPLKLLGTPLYEAGGRLEGVCKPEDLGREQLLLRWLRVPGMRFSPVVARRVGALGFTAGDWWLTPIFAFRSGILDSASSHGSITSDTSGAYALLMTSDEEINSLTPEAFTYRAKPEDLGRYRLTAATREARLPVRVLRGAGLRSFWAPGVGVRFDGLHVVTGWSITPTPTTTTTNTDTITDNNAATATTTATDDADIPNNEAPSKPHSKKKSKQQPLIYLIHFRRLPTEPPMEQVLRRPYADEVEDYKEFKRLRGVVRAKLQKEQQRKMPATRADDGVGIGVAEVGVEGSSEFGDGDEDVGE